MAKLVSKTYGQALFDLAIENHVAQEIKEEVLFIRQLLQDEKEILEFLNHPKISKEEKISFIETTFTGKLSQTMVGFLVVVVTKGRYDELDNILLYFIALMKEYEGIGVVHIETAVALSDTQVEKIKSKLLAITNYKTLEMDIHVDESLIGGLIIRIGDRVVDNSIKSKINTLQKSLVSVSVS